MDTVSNDLFNLLLKHFDVLATIFLTNKQLELEDADVYGFPLMISDNPTVYDLQKAQCEVFTSVYGCEQPRTDTFVSTYKQENWPWILTNLKFNFIPMEACVQDGDKHRILEHLDAVIDPQDPTKSYVGHIYQLAHQYNQKKLIKRYSKAKNSDLDSTLAIYYALQAGHTDLFLEHIDSISNNNFHLEAVFGSGNPEVIKLFNLGPHNLESWIFGALQQTIEHNHLDLLKDLIEKYPDHVNSELSTVVFELSAIGTKTLDTLVWLFESGFINMTKYTLNTFLPEMIRLNCQTRLFQYVVNRFNTLINEIDIYPIIICALEYNRLDCALCLRMDEATIFNNLQEEDRNKLKETLIKKGFRKLYNKLIQN